MLDINTSLSGFFSTFWHYYYNYPYYFQFLFSEAKQDSSINTDTTQHFVPATCSPRRRRMKRKLPGILIPETQPSEPSSADSDNNYSPPNDNSPKPKPQKQVRFKELSSSAVESDNELPLINRSHQSSQDSDNEIQLTRRGYENRIFSCSTYSSSDTDSADVIHNAQQCKYGDGNKISDDEANDEHATSTTPPVDDVSTPIEDLEPTPVPPEGMSQPQQRDEEDGPMTSTPKESVSGVYSLISAQPRLSNL